MLALAAHSMPRKHSRCVPLCEPARVNFSACPPNLVAKQSRGVVAASTECVGRHIRDVVLASNGTRNARRDAGPLLSKVLSGGAECEYGYAYTPGRWDLKR